MPIWRGANRSEPIIRSQWIRHCSGRDSASTICARGSLCRPLVEFLAPAGELVVEIGPGGGVLTGALLAAGARVTAWELDRLGFRVRAPFASRRRAFESSTPTLSSCLGTAAGADPGCRQSALQRGDRFDRSNARIGSRAIDRAAFLVQLEVAERLVARPGTKAYGAASVLTEARAERQNTWVGCGPGSFVPPPKVDSAFVGFDRSKRRASAQRRSLLFEPWSTRPSGSDARLCATLWRATGLEGQAAAAIERTGLPAEVRAERVSYVDFVELLNQLDSV